jgi:hypothetical protein
MSQMHRILGILNSEQQGKHENWLNERVTYVTLRNREQERSFVTPLQRNYLFRVSVVRAKFKI